MTRLLPLVLARRLRPAAGWVGVRWIPAGAAVVLMYHRVAEASFDPWRLAVSPAWFDEQMAVLRERFRPVPLTTLAAAVAAGTLPPRSVVVTFDDGYLDGLQNAKPALERHGVPATVFVTSGYIDSGKDFWWHELERLCFHPSRPVDGALHLGPLVADWGAPNDVLYLGVWRGLQPLPDRERSELLNELRLAVGAVPSTSANTMTQTELSELARGDLVEIGAHSLTHPSLPTLPRSAQLEEIRESRLQLEELLGRPVRSFSYPHGNLTPETVACVREAGFDQACSSVPTVVQPGVDRFQLPRRHVLNWRGDEFAWQLSRFFRDRSRA